MAAIPTFEMIQGLMFDRTLTPIPCMLPALHRQATRSHRPSIAGTPAPHAAAPTARAVSFFGAKRSLRLAVRPNFLTLAGPNSNFPMMGWTRVKVFNRLEGGVCTMCAPRDQRKSGDDQFKQVEVNELWHQWRPDISGGHIKWSLLFKADVEP
jgi:hypothetical protein